MPTTSSEQGVNHCVICGSTQAPYIEYPREGSTVLRLCENCIVESYSLIIDKKLPPDTDARMSICSFCDERARKTFYLESNLEARICVDCLQLFVKLLYEETRKKASVKPDVFDSTLEEIIYQQLQKSFVKNYSVLPNYPLAAFMNVQELLRSLPEKRTWDFLLKSRVDFLVVFKADVRPLIAVEIDTPDYHLSEEARRRDKYKNEIFELAHFPLLRFWFERGDNDYGKVVKGIKEEILRLRSEMEKRKGT